jgi:hypothetical protein
MYLPSLVNEFYVLYGEIGVIAALGPFGLDDKLVQSRTQYNERKEGQGWA